MTVRYLVSGVVQGVGFRYFVARRASALGLAGYAANLPDGRVEVLAKGPQDRLHALELALRSGPPHARVTNVENLEISDEDWPLTTFEIR